MEKVKNIPERKRADINIRPAEILYPARSFYHINTTRTVSYDF